MKTTIILSCTLLFSATLTLITQDVEAAKKPTCEAADRRLAKTGKGDFDHDGISNCRERLILKTKYRDSDTDDDGINDGDELTIGTNPRDADSDNDGFDDGYEIAIGTNPNDSDSDDDGVSDGRDPDPINKLNCELVGNIQDLTCPAQNADGTMVLLGANILLKSTTIFKGVANCDALATHLYTKGNSHVEVELVEAVNGRINICNTDNIAIKISLEDIDGDGSPNFIDNDDDGDGISDDKDDDSDGDGISDDRDDDADSDDTSDDEKDDHDRDRGHNDDD